MVKQVMFLDMEDEPPKKLGGIMLDNGDVVCGCCGGVFEAADRGETWELVKEFDSCVLSSKKSYGTLPFVVSSRPLECSLCKVQILTRILIKAM